MQHLLFSLKRRMLVCVWGGGCMAFHGACHDPPMPSSVPCQNGPSTERCVHGAVVYNGRFPFHFLLKRFGTAPSFNPFRDPSHART